MQEHFAVYTGVCDSSTFYVNKATRLGASQCNDHGAAMVSVGELHENDLCVSQYSTVQCVGTQTLSLKA